MSSAGTGAGPHGGVSHRELPQVELEVRMIVRDLPSPRTSAGGGRQYAGSRRESVMRAAGAARRDTAEVTRQMLTALREAGPSPELPLLSDLPSVG
jgi:hypothetical protein